MNEEIIEILKGLENISTPTGISYSGDITINNDDVKILEDYITNLQQKVEQLEKENKILKENAEHNDKVVDKVNWENMLLKRKNKEIDRLNNIIKQIEELCDKHELGKYDYSVPVFELKEVIKSECRKHNK